MDHVMHTDAQPPRASSSRGRLTRLKAGRGCRPYHTALTRSVMPHQPGLKLTQTITQIDAETANFLEVITEPLGYDKQCIVVMIESAIEALEDFRKEVEAR